MTPSKVLLLLLINWICFKFICDVQVLPNKLVAWHRETRLCIEQAHFWRILEKILQRQPLGVFRTDCGMLARVRQKANIYALFWIHLCLLQEMMLPHVCCHCSFWGVLPRFIFLWGLYVWVHHDWLVLFAVVSKFDSWPLAIRSMKVPAFRSRTRKWWHLICSAIYWRFDKLRFDLTLRRDQLRNDWSCLREKAPHIKML